MPVSYTSLRRKRINIVIFVFTYHRNQFICFPMEGSHKQSLRRNRVALVERLKPSDLYDALVEKRVFSQDMIDEIKVGLCNDTVTCCVALPATLCQHW